MIRRLLFILCVVLIGFVSLSFADTNSDLNRWFDHLGFSAHIDHPTTYASQAAGYVSLGSIDARNEVRNLHMMQVDVPGYRSGCGGIDLFAGGFSFIKADQIVKFMQSILSSGGGYALNLALEVELPEVAHALQYMQTIANKINSQNFNACEMGEEVVGGLWPKTRASQQQICQDLGTHSGAFADWAYARQQCSTGGAIGDQLAQAKNDPAYQYRVYNNTNIIWDRVVKRNAFLARDEKLGEMYMTISGTMIFDKNGAITTYPSKVTGSAFIKALLYGGKLPTYTCKDGTKHCLDLAFSPSNDQTITATNALVPQVEKLLTAIYTHLKENTPLSDEAMGLISLTQSPVFSVISADAQQGLGVQGLATFAQMVATDLLADYLKSALDVIESSLSGTQLDKNNVQSLVQSIQKAHAFVDQFNTATRAKFQQALSINLSVQQMMRQAMASLTPALRMATQGQQ